MVCPFCIRLAFLRCHDYYTVGGPCAVQDLRRSVFEDLDGLDFLGDEVGQRPFHPVDDDKRGVGAHSVLSADVEIRDIVSETVHDGAHLQAGYLSLQHVCESQVRIAVKLSMSKPGCRSHSGILRIGRIPGEH